MHKSYPHIYLYSFPYSYPHPNTNSLPDSYSHPHSISKSIPPNHLQLLRQLGHRALVPLY